MSSGATAVLAPPKPWERSPPQGQSAAEPVAALASPAAVTAMSANAAAAAPPPLPPPLPSNPPFNSPFAPQPPSSAPASAYYSQPYNYHHSPFSSYGGVGALSYPSPYGSSYHYGGGSSAPYSSSLSAHPPYSLESTARPLLDSLNHVIQAINHVACFLDSTVFSVWTAISAVTGLVSAVRGINTRGWLLWLKQKLVAIKQLRGRRRLLLLAGVLAVLVVNLFGSGKGTTTTATDTSNNNNNNNLDSSDDNQTASVTSNQISVANDDFTFVRANYAFDPLASGNGVAAADNQLAFKAGDVLLVSKADVDAIAAGESKWIVGRMKDGRNGFFPSNYVSIIK